MSTDFQSQVTPPTPYQLLLMKLFGSFPNTPTSAATIASYTEMLSDIPLDQLRHSINTAITNSTFLPTIAEIRKTALMLTTPAIPDAITAWMEIKAALKNPKFMIGDCVTEPKITNPIAARIAKALGWRNIYFNTDYLQRAFVSAYNQQTDNEKVNALLSPETRLFKESQEMKKLSEVTLQELEAYKFPDLRDEEQTQ